MSSNSQQEIAIQDVTQAAGVLCACVAAAALLYGQFSAVPGFIWPAFAAIGAAGAEVGRRCWRAPAPAAVLAKLSPTFVSTAFGAVIFALVMPALFPNGAYEQARWLVWIDAIFLLGGLLAVPAARLMLGIAARFARRRVRSGPGAKAPD